MSQGGVLSDKTGSQSTIDFLTGNTGGPVGPDAGHNINVLGSGVVAVTGNPGTHTLTISVSGEGITWNKISSSQSLVVNNGYFCVGGGALSLALPATSAVGNVIDINLNGSTSFTVTQAAGQQILLGNLSSTSGVTGTLASTQQGDTVRMICLTANLTWVVFASMGNLILT